MRPRLKNIRGRAREKKQKEKASLWRMSEEHEQMISKRKEHSFKMTKKKKKCDQLYLTPAIVKSKNVKEIGK